jgi:hypothetical protein
VQASPHRVDTPWVADPASPASIAGPTTTDHHWWVACADPFGRDRALNVLVRDGAVVMVAPPGESAVLSAHQTRQLGRTLAYAAAHAGP